MSPRAAVRQRSDAGSHAAPPHCAIPRQWYLNVSWLLLGGLALMISVHTVPFARDQGISLAAASLALTAYGIGSVSGRLTAGAVSDRLGHPHDDAPRLRAADRRRCWTLLCVPSRGPLLLGRSGCSAIGFAASDTMVAKVVPDVFGLRAIGAIMGVLKLGWRCGAALGPAIAGFVYDATGSYRIPFGAAPVVVLVSWGLFNLATRAGR